MLGLHSLLDPVKKGTRLPLREGGREGGTPNATSCGFSTRPAKILYVG